MAHCIIFLVVLLVLADVAYGGHEKYEGHQLYQVEGAKEELAYLDAHLDLLSAVTHDQSSPGHLQALVRLSPEQREQWLQYFDAKNMEYTKILSSTILSCLIVSSILRDEEVKIEAAKVSARLSGRSMSWDTYYRHNEINNYLHEIEAKYPDLVSVVDADLSFEGRQIKYLRISTTGFGDLRKPVIIIDAAIHAREWITTPVALFTINQLVVDIADSVLTENLDWVIIPVVNPDGYEYSFDEDRMWRKSRSVSNASSCLGVDLNRNFNHWWSSGNSDPCSAIYRGPYVFSESESRVVRVLVWQQIRRASLYISLHSHGNMILYSWGNNGSVPSNVDSIHLGGVKMAEAMDALALEKARSYVVGNAFNLHPVTGVSVDWARSAGVPLTYALQLPGFEYGFLVPPEYIQHIVKETWAGIAAGGHYVLSLFPPCPCRCDLGARFTNHGEL